MLPVWVFACSQRVVGWQFLQGISGVPLALLEHICAGSPSADVLFLSSPASPVISLSWGCAAQETPAL